MTIPVRLLFAVPRSGSTLFMSIMSNLPNVAVTSRTILMGNVYKTSFVEDGAYTSESDNFAPDYSIYHTHPCGHPAIAMAERRGVDCLISKEEVGNNCRKGSLRDNECTFQLYPDEKTLLSVRPVFTFRDPVACFSSWEKRGWEDLSSFILAYKNVFATYQTAKRLRPETVAYKFEDITDQSGSAQAVFQTICADWNLKYDPFMLQLDENFADRLLFWHPREARIYKHENPKGIFTTLKSAKEIVKPISQKAKLPKAQKNELERHLTPLYSSIDTSRFHKTVARVQQKQHPPNGGLEAARLEP